ncbi:MAG: hypothetical protein K0S55_484 [Clostridia bacterium]|nr:hypothetical protein [Clostridia bacterium]
MMKKITQVSLLLILLSVFITFGACNGVESENLEFNEEKDVEIDLMGRDFVILQAADPQTDPLGLKMDTMLADEALKRIEEVGNVYNCNIILDYVGGDPVYQQTLMNTLASMDNLYDITYGGSWITRAIGNAGGLVPMDDVEHIINFRDSEKWGTLNAQEMIMCKGVLYGVIPNLWINVRPLADYLIVFNNELLKSFNAPDLREMLEQKQWTREALENILITCTDPARSTPVYGMAASKLHILRSSLLSNKCNFINENSDGTIYCGYDSEAAIEAIAYAQKLVKEYKDYLHNKGNDLAAGNWGFTAPFNNNEATLLLTSFWNITGTIQYELKDFGLLPWPVGPYGEYGEWPAYYEDATVITIPVFAYDYEESAYITDALFKGLDSYPDIDSIKNYYTDQLFHDPRDAELFVSLGKNAQYSYWIDGGDNMLYNIVNSLTSKTPIELIETSINSIQKCIEEQIMPNYESMEKYMH